MVMSNGSDSPGLQALHGGKVLSRSVTVRPGALDTANGNRL
jgi:hypothetical protein